MSRERKFHEFIEEQNREEKDAVWAKIQQQDEPIPISPKARSFSWRKWTPILASSLAAVVIGVFATWGFLSLKDGNDDNKGRYFNSQSYETVNTQSTLKGYAQEIICFQEEIADVDTDCIVYIYVIQADIEIEGFFGDEETERTSEVDGIQIDWKYSKYNSNANFIYEDYKYYLRVDDPIDENYILDLVAELLP